MGETEQKAGKLGLYAGLAVLSVLLIFTWATSDKPMITDLDSLPFPDRQLYRSKFPYFKNSPITSMIATRGCPYKCTFCEIPSYMDMYETNKFYYRSAENIIAEVNDLKKAIEELSALLRVKGHVLPVTYDQANLCARLENGDIIYTESDIDLRSDSIPPIETVYLDHAVKVNQEAVNAIDSADLVLLGPGDLYTSIIPNFLVPEIKNAISSTRACVVYVGNLMTKRGETSGYKASKFISEVCRYSGRETLDYLILNNATLSDEVKFAYKKEQAEPVIIDDEVSNYANNVIIKDLVKLEGTTVRHDPKLLTDEIMAFIELCSNTITE